MKHEQSLRTVLFDLPSFFFYSSRRVLWRWKAQSRIFVSNEGRRGFHGFTNICTILHSFARVCVCVRGCLHGVNAGESCEHENKTSQKGALGNQVYSSTKLTTHKKKWNKNNVEVSAAKEHGFIFQWKKPFSGDVSLPSNVRFWDLGGNLSQMKHCVKEKWRCIQGAPVVGIKATLSKHALVRN